MNTILMVLAALGFLSAVRVVAEGVYRSFSKALADKNTMFLYVQFVMWKRKKTPLTPNEAWLGSKLMEGELLVREMRQQLVWNKEYFERKIPGHIAIESFERLSPKVDKYLADMPTFTAKTLDEGFIKDLLK